MKRAYVYLLLMSLTSCDGGAQKGIVPSSQGTESRLASPCVGGGACQVSMVGVLAMPNLFDEREIRTVGYLVPRGNETRLYLDSESARENILDRSVLMRYDNRYPRTQRMFSGPARYVSVVGVFSDEAERKGRLHESFEGAGTLAPTFPPSAIKGADVEESRNRQSGPSD